MRKSIIAMTLVLSGCVSAPMSIPPSLVKDAKYDNMTCEQLRSEKSQLELDLADLSGKQDAARARAAAYNLVLIVGAGALVRDRSDEIGEVKGRIAIVEEELSNCISSQ